MNGKTDNPAEIGMHIFERAGLGAAPFRCVGFTEIVFTMPDGTTKAGGSCDYCGTGIRDAYWIMGRDGKKFKVGCDCVEKTGDAGLIRGYKNHPEVRAMRRMKTKAKDDRVKAEFAAMMADPAVVAKLSAVFVPGRPWIPGDKVSMFEDVKRVWGMCGASGRARHLKRLKNVVNVT